MDDCVGEYSVSFLTDRQLCHPPLKTFVEFSFFSSSQTTLSSYDHSSYKSIRRDALGSVMTGWLSYCNIKPRFKTEKMFSVVLFCVKSSSSNGHLLVKTWRKDLHRLNRRYRVIERDCKL